MTMHINKALDDIRAELFRANVTHGDFHSAHEAYAVLKEEVDELWAAIKTNAPASKLREEAIQVGAMALKFIIWLDRYQTVPEPQPDLHDRPLSTISGD